MIKFLGTKEDFLEILNEYFKKKNKLTSVNKNNIIRYIIKYNNKKTNINLFTNGTVNIQPSNDELYSIINNLLSEENNNFEVTEVSKNPNKKVFIVHGHDKNSKTQLENILYKWKLEPYAIQDEDSKGKTIIEFLETEIKNNTSISIILLTPDDIGYSKKQGEESKKPRARQNVILELGMLIGAIGRERCIILKKTEVENPSDIDGLIYIPFDNDIAEIKEKLKQKLINLGLKIK